MSKRLLDNNSFSHSLSATESDSRIGWIPIGQVIVVALALAAVAIIAAYGPTQRLVVIYQEHAFEGNPTEFVTTHLDELSGHNHVYRIALVIVATDRTDDSSRQSGVPVDHWSKPTDIAEFYEPSTEVAFSRVLEGYRGLGWWRTVLEKVAGITWHVVMVTGNESITSSDRLVTAAQKLALMHVVVDIVSESAGSNGQHAASLGLRGGPVNAASALTNPTGNPRHLTVTSDQPLTLVKYSCSIDGDAFRADGTSPDGTIPWTVFKRQSESIPENLPFGFHRVDCILGTGSVAVHTTAYVASLFTNIRLIQGKAGTLIQSDLTNLSSRLFDATGDKLDLVDHEQSLQNSVSQLLNDDAADSRLRPKLVIVDNVSASFWQQACQQLHTLTELGTQIYIIGPPTYEQAQAFGCEWLPGFALTSGSGMGWTHQVGRSIRVLEDPSPFGEITVTPNSYTTQTCATDDPTSVCIPVIAGSVIQTGVENRIAQELRLRPEIVKPAATDLGTAARLKAFSVDARIRQLLSQDSQAQLIAPVGELLIVFAYDLPQIESESTNWRTVRSQGRQIILVTMKNQMTRFLSADKTLTEPLAQWFSEAESDLKVSLGTNPHLPLSSAEIEGSLSTIDVDLVNADETKVVESIVRQIQLEVGRGVGNQQAHVASVLVGRLGLLQDDTSPERLQFLRPNGKWGTEVYDQWLPGVQDNYLSDKPVTFGSVEGRASVVASGEPLQGRALDRLFHFIFASLALETAPRKPEITAISDIGETNLQLTVREPHLSGPSSIPEHLDILRCASGWQDQCNAIDSTSPRSAKLVLPVDLRNELATYQLDVSQMDALCQEKQSCVLSLAQNTADRFLWTKRTLSSPTLPDDSAMRRLRQIALITGGNLVDRLGLLSGLDGRRVIWFYYILVAVLLGSALVRSMTRMVRMRNRKNIIKRRMLPDFEGDRLLSAKGSTESGRPMGNPSGGKPLESGDTLQHLTTSTILAWTQGLHVTPRLAIHEATVAIPLRINLRRVETSLKKESLKTLPIVHVTELLSGWALNAGREVWVSLDGIRYIHFARFPGTEDLRQQLSRLIHNPNISDTEMIPASHSGDLLLISDFLGGFSDLDRWLIMEERQGNRFLGAVCIIDPLDWQGGGFVWNKGFAHDRTGWSHTDEEVLRRSHQSASRELVQSRGGVLAVINSTSTAASWIQAIVSSGFYELITM